MPVTPAPHFRFRPRKFGQKAIWQLAFAETIVWAGFYYLFPALLPRWEQDFGWAKTDITIAMTLALVVSALATPYAGSLIDRGYGRTLLVGCAAFGSLLVASLTLVSTPLQFYGLWLLIGLMMGGSLYDPCFSFLTRTYGGGARQAITLVALVAGFAGTLSFSLSNILAEPFGWRVSALTFAVLLLLVAAPLFWLGTRPGSTNSEATETETPDSQKAGRRMARSKAFRNPVFWFLATAFSLIYLNHGMMITHFLPMLDERGVSLEIAVVAISFIGPLQVAGRVVMVMVEKRVSTRAICTTAFASMVLASAALFAAHWSLLLLPLFVLFQGASIGVMSILRPVVTAEYLGRAHFGTVYGVLAMPVTASFAFAPWLGAIIWTFGGYDSLLFATAIMALAALLFFVLAATHRQSA